MQAIPTRKYLSGAALLSLGFAAVFALSWRKQPSCVLPSMLIKPQTTVSKTGAEKMATTQLSGSVEHASDSNFDQLVLKSSAPVLVDFYTQWCGPCKRLAPVLEELAAETPDIRVVKIDVDENPRLAARYQIESIPSLKVFRNGKITAETLGLVSKEDLKDMLRQ